MRTIFKNLVLLVLLFLLSESTYSQNVFGPAQPNRIREMEKIGSASATSQLRSINGSCFIGKSVYSSVQAELRTLIQWDIPDNIIPDNSTISRVRLYFTYTKIDHSFNLNVDFVTISMDIANLTQVQNNQIWNEFGTNFIELGYGSSDIMVFESNNPNNDFNLAVRNALLNDRFVLGMRAYASVSERLWMIQNPSITLEIEFEPPLITIDQRLSNNQQVGVLKKCEGSNWSNNLNPGSQFYFPVNSQQTILGDQEIHSNQKYNRWTTITGNENDVSNHHTFTIRSNDNNLTSRFEPTASACTLKNSLEGTSVTGGSLFFYDPWLIDYPDPEFPNPQGGYYKRNQGMDAPPKQRTSPFYPDYATNYNGDVYQGVFLDQLISSGTYYNAWAGDQQIPLGGSIGTRDFYLMNWTASGADLQAFTPNHQRVVFTSSNAVVQANFKGLGLSNQQNAYNSNSQRKVIRLENSNYLMSIYKSIDNKLWLEQSNNNGTSWFLKNSSTPGTPFENDWSNEFSTPAIDYIPWGVSHPFAAVVHNLLKLSIVRENIGIPYYSEGIPLILGDNASYPISPAIGVTSNRILIVCNGGKNSSSQEGLAYFYGTISLSGGSTITVNWTDGHSIWPYKIIPGTNYTSLQILSSLWFHLKSILKSI